MESIDKQEMMPIELFMISLFKRATTKAVDMGRKYYQQLWNLLRI